MHDRLGTRARSAEDLGLLAADNGPTRFSKVLLNGVLIGSYFAVVQQRSTKLLLGAFFLAGVFFLTNRVEMLRNGRQFRFNFTPRIGLCLLGANIVIMAWQQALLDGVATGIKTATVELVLAAMIVQLALSSAPRYVKPVLVTLAFALACFGALNVVADWLGIGSELLLARTDLFVSRYVAGQARWQSPLYSSWQVSGLLRWAAPVLLVTLVKDTRGPWSRVLLTAGVVVTTYVLYKCEFRAAIFPLLGAIIWWFVRSERWRAVLCAVYVAYAISVPALFYSETFLTLRDRAAPAFLFAIAGNQDPTEVLSLSGRTDMWQAGVDVLLSGKHFWIGQGHVMLDSVSDVGAIWTDIDPSLFRRLSYHQATLDLLFIYGVVPAGLLIAGLLAAVCRGLRRSSRRPTLKWQAEDTSFALFALGMVGLANCHDGFLVENNFYYFVCIVAACALTSERLEAANRAHTLVPRRRPLLVSARKTGMKQQIDGVDRARVFTR